MPCRFASSGTVATSRSASRAILALNAASNFLRDLVISVLHRLRQSRTLHTLTFGPISGVHFKLLEKIVDMCTRYRGTLLIEDSPISKGLIQALKNKNVNVVTVTPDKEKRSRVIAQSDLFEGGSIFVQEHAEWREIFIREL